jgi:hypothetical protein
MAGTLYQQRRLRYKNRESIIEAIKDFANILVESTKNEKLFIPEEGKRAPAALGKAIASLEKKKGRNIWHVQHKMFQLTETAISLFLEKKDTEMLATVDPVQLPLPEGCLKDAA